MSAFWYAVNSFSAKLFTIDIIPGPGQAAITTPEYFKRPRPWHDQRGIIDPSEPEQPQSIDFTDLYAIGWNPKEH